MNKDIIEILELVADDLKSNNENISAVLDYEDLKSLQNLYNSYKEQYIQINHFKEKATRRKKEITALIEKQKENKKTVHKLNSIKGEWKKFKREIKKLEQELNKEKEMNKKLVSCHFRYESMTGVDLLLPDKPDYISKYKIKEAIQKWDREIAWANADDHYYAIKILKELLEE